HIDHLAQQVVSGGYDLGIAFDGDADRCLAVDEKGVLIDGDQVMAICGMDMESRGELPEHTLVATVMSNLGFHIFAKEHGLNLVCTAVGDRNVLEEMERGGFVLGGEQSGHTIFRKYATTGDGELTALQLLAVLYKQGKKPSEAVSFCVRYPQTLLNVPVATKEKKEEIMASPILRESIAKVERELNGSGRVLVRPSGTEPLVRVMVEAPEEAEALAKATELENLIKTL
ncbi:MAG: phosphoglucosamine mutase, partial [Oscillospiraceae bacterium]|nr:phosphoglucosamine mutase [Oscillospiraceae bacterium]